MEKRSIARSIELDERLVQLEERMKAHTTQECERIETKPLTEFRKWGRTSDMRTKLAIDNVAALNERLMVLEDRISSLERRSAA